MPIYLGKSKDGDLVQFHSPAIPTKESHGHLYTAVIGPFKSKVGASYFARYGQNNPLIRTAHDAELLARADPRMEQTIVEESMTGKELAIAQECAAQDQFESSPQTILLPVIPVSWQMEINKQGENLCPSNLNING